MLEELREGLEELREVVIRAARGGYPKFHGRVFSRVRGLGHLSPSSCVQFHGRVFHGQGY